MPTVQHPEPVATGSAQATNLPPARRARVARMTRGRLRPGAALCTLPAVVWFLLFFVAPLVTLAIYSVLTPALFGVHAPYTLENYKEAATSSLPVHLVWNSVIVGLLVATICVVVGIAVAYWLTYCAGRLRIPVLFIITVTVFANYLVRIYAWRLVLGQDGAVAWVLTHLGFSDHAVRGLLFSRFAVTVALVHLMLPMVVLLMLAAFRPIESRYLEAAQDLGGGAVTRWVKVILPLIAAPAATAFILTFVLASGDYVTPAFLGGAGGQLYGVQILAAFQTTGDWALGAALSFLALGVYLVAYLFMTAALRLAGIGKIRWGT
jgi:spermidine/putrescine transport system permease protein